MFGEANARAERPVSRQLCLVFECFASFTLVWFVHSAASVVTDPCGFISVGNSVVYNADKESCYVIFYESQRRADAAAICSATNGGHLVVTEDTASLALIRTNLATGVLVWTDGYELEYNAWTWTSSGLILGSYAPWQGGSTTPVATSNQDCVTMVQKNSGDSFWQPQDCSLPFPFICQTSPSSMFCNSTVMSGVLVIQLAAVNLCYLVYERTPMSWFGAQQTCLSVGASFVQLTFSDLADMLTSQLPQSAGPAYWIGLSRTAWIWETSGDQILINNWAAGQPSSAGSCLLLDSPTLSSWQAADCDLLHSFICQIASQILTTSTVQFVPTLTTASFSSSSATSTTNISYLTLFTTSPAPFPSSSSTVSPGLIGGLVAIGILIILAVAFLIFLVLRMSRRGGNFRRKNQSTSQNNGSRSRPGLNVSHNLEKHEEQLDNIPSNAQMSNTERGVKELPQNGVTKSATQDLFVTAKTFSNQKEKELFHSRKRPVRSIAYTVPDNNIVVDNIPPPIRKDPNELNAQANRNPGVARSLDQSHLPAGRMERYHTLPPLSSETKERPHERNEGAGAVTSEATHRRKAKRQSELTNRRDSGIPLASAEFVPDEDLGQSREVSIDRNQSSTTMKLVPLDSSVKFVIPNVGESGETVTKSIEKGDATEDAGGGNASLQDGVKGTQDQTMLPPIAKRLNGTKTKTTSFINQGDGGRLRSRVQSLVRLKTTDFISVNEGQNSDKAVTNNTSKSVKPRTSRSASFDASTMPSSQTSFIPHVTIIRASPIHARRFSHDLFANESGSITVLNETGKYPAVTASFVATENILVTKVKPIAQISVTGERVSAPQIDKTTPDVASHSATSINVVNDGVKIVSASDQIILSGELTKKIVDDFAQHRRRHRNNGNHRETRHRRHDSDHRHRSHDREENRRRKSVNPDNPETISSLVLPGHSSVSQYVMEQKQKDLIVDSDLHYGTIAEIAGANPSSRDSDLCSNIEEIAAVNPNPFERRGSFRKKR